MENENYMESNSKYWNLNNLVEISNTKLVG